MVGEERLAGLHSFLCVDVAADEPCKEEGKDDRENGPLDDYAFLSFS